MHVLTTFTIFVGLFAIKGCHATCSGDTSNVVTMCKNSVKTGTELRLDTSLANTLVLPDGTSTMIGCTCFVETRIGKKLGVWSTFNGIPNSACGTSVKIGANIGQGGGTPCYSAPINLNVGSHNNVSVEMEFKRIRTTYDANYCVKFTLNYCSVTRYQCNNGACIRNDHVCDSVPDCAEDEDEINCAGSCSEGFILCDDNRTCISPSMRCDNHSIDCPDGSDEAPKNCDPNFVPSTGGGSGASLMPQMTITCLESEYLPVPTTTTSTSTSSTTTTTTTTTTSSTTTSPTTTTNSTSSSTTIPSTTSTTTSSPTSSTSTTSTSSTTIPTTTSTSSPTTTTITTSTSSTTIPTTTSTASTATSTSSTTTPPPTSTTTTPLKITATIPTTTTTTSTTTTQPSTNSTSPTTQKASPPTSSTIRTSPDAQTTSTSTTHSTKPTVLTTLTTKEETTTDKTATETTTQEQTSSSISSTSTAATESTSKESTTTRSSSVPTIRTSTSTVPPATTQQQVVTTEADDDDKVLIVAIVSGVAGFILLVVCIVCWVRTAHWNRQKPKMKRFITDDGEPPTHAWYPAVENNAYTVETVLKAEDLKINDVYIADPESAPRFEPIYSFPKKKTKANEFILSSL